MENGQKADWTNLPSTLEEVSLWGCLHDGELLSCESNIERRHIRFEFSIDHLDEGDTDLTRFFLDITSVNSVRAHLVFRRLGDFKEPVGATPEQRAALVQAYQEKWREESIGWPEFESILFTDPLQVSDAGMVESEDTQSLRLAGFLNGEKFHDVYCEVFVSGAEISAARSDTKEFSLSGFIELGDKYWETLGK